MIDGIIALLIGFFTNYLLQPYFDMYKEFQLNQGIPLKSFETQLNLVNLAFQILIFLIVYGIIRLVKKIIGVNS